MNPGFLCIQPVIKYMTRLTPASLLTAMTQSEAYLTDSTTRSYPSFRNISIGIYKRCVKSY